MLEPTWAPAAPTPITFARRGSPKSLEGSPSDARKRSTSPGSPITARPSPLLITWISLSAVCSWVEGVPSLIPLRQVSSTLRTDKHSNHLAVQTALLTVTG